MVDVNSLIQNKDFEVLNSDGESVTINTSNITESDSDLTKKYKLIFDGLKTFRKKVSKCEDTNNGVLNAEVIHQIHIQGFNDMDEHLQVSG